MHIDIENIFLFTKKTCILHFDEYKNKQIISRNIPGKCTLVVQFFKKKRRCTMTCLIYLIDNMLDQT